MFIKKKLELDSIVPMRWFRYYKIYSNVGFGDKGCSCDSGGKWQEKQIDQINWKIKITGTTNAVKQLFSFRHSFSAFCSSQESLPSMHCVFYLF